MSVYTLGLRQTGIVEGRLYQDATFILAFAFLAIATSYYNAKNNKYALWVNTIGTTVSDLPFVIFLVLPGLVPPPTNFLGPVLWVSAISVSMLAYKLRPKEDRDG